MLHFEFCQFGTVCLKFLEYLPAWHTLFSPAYLHLSRINVQTEDLITDSTVHTQFASDNRSIDNFFGALRRGSILFYSFHLLFWKF